MSRILHCAVIAIVLQLVIASCSFDAANGGKSTDIQLRHQGISDTVIFKLSDSRVCSVRTEIEADYPEYYKNDTLTRKMQSLYMNTIVEGNIADTTGIAHALSMLSKKLIWEYGNEEDILHEEDFVEYGAALQSHSLDYVIKMNITIKQECDGIVTLCRQETVTKNGEQSVDSHQYTNIDLATMTVIDVYDLFSDDSDQDIAELLKQKLMLQSNAKNEEELISMGYFNLDNIAVTNNFYITDQGVTWNYTTYEIACYSVGETQVTLTYNELSPYIEENTILYKYISK